MKNLISKFISMILFTVVTCNVNAACALIAHQPELPEGALKLSKLD